jgi:hypothetical protein
MEMVNASRRKARRIEGSVFTREYVPTESSETSNIFLDAQTEGVGSKRGGGDRSDEGRLA